MKNRKQTSPRIATLAAKTLADEHASKKARTLAASALAQSAFANHLRRGFHLRKTATVDNVGGHEATADRSASEKALKRSTRKPHAA